MTEEQVMYETISQEELRYGVNNTKFLEISRKKAPDSNEFIAIAKGYYNKNAEKRYKTTIGFPVDQKLVDFLVNEIQKAYAESQASAAEEPTEPQAAEEPTEPQAAEEPTEPPATEEPTEPPAAEEPSETGTREDPRLL